MRPLGILIPILFLFVPTLAQVSANNAVFVFAEHGARNSKCGVENEVVGPEELIKYRDNGNCGILPVAEYIDFENFSIITYQMAAIVE